MNKDLISLEGGKTILNVNAIAMVFPDDDKLDDITCINFIGGGRTFFIKENYESVKKKLDDWLIKEPSNPKIKDECKAWKFNDEYCRCCLQDSSIPCLKKEEN